MASRRSVRIKSTSVLNKLKTKIESKPKVSVGAQDVNLKRAAAAANNQREAAKQHTRTRRSSTADNKQKENAHSEVLTKTRNVANKEDSRVKSCAVLAVKLKYPYVTRTTTVKLNSRNNSKSSVSSKAVAKTAKSPEIDLDVQGSSRKSSRMKKPTSKELRSVLESTDNKSELKKHKEEVSPQKVHSKPEISNGIFIPNQKAQASKLTNSGKNVISGKKVEDDLECVRCGLTPSQLFGKDLKHDTVCCFCSLVKPPQELAGLLQLLKLNCCLKFLNQQKQNVVESSSTSSRRTSDHNAQTDKLNATTSGNSYVKTLREKNVARSQKEQQKQNSTEEQKKNTSHATRPVRQLKGNSILHKISNMAESSNSAAASSPRTSTRLIEKSSTQVKLSKKTGTKNTVSAIKNLHRNLKRKLTSQSTQTLPKKRKLMENAEVKKKTAREHTCNFCNSSFAVQWKLKLHELTHTDKSYPNVILRHTEVGSTQDGNKMNAENSEGMECDPNNENMDTENANGQVSEHAGQRANSAIEQMQESKTTSDNENCKKDGDKLEQGNEVMEGNQENANKDNSNQMQNTENIEVNQESDGQDSHNAPAECNIHADKENIEVNQQPDELSLHDAPIKCDENNLTGHSTKINNDVSSKKSDLSCSVEDTILVGTSGHSKDKEQDKIKPSEAASDKNEAKENEDITEENQSLDTISAKDAQEQLEIQELHEVGGRNENSMESEETDQTIAVNEKAESPEITNANIDENLREESISNGNGFKIAEERNKIHEDEGEEADESAKMGLNLSEENNSLKNSSDLCEENNSFKNTSNLCEESGDKRLVTEAESSCSGNTEVTPMQQDNDQHVSKNHEIKVNGTVIDDNESRNAVESANAASLENAVNHAVDNNNSEQSVDENMTDLYNQMNMIFEDNTGDGRKRAKTDN